jgi:BMFP domain-containing protein YqiC
MPPENRLFEDLARVASGALGAAAGLRDEIEGMVRQRVERIAADLNLVSREEYEAALELAQRARAEQVALSAELAAMKAAGEQREADLDLRLAALEAKLAAAAPAGQAQAQPGGGGAVPNSLA